MVHLLHRARGIAHHTVVTLMVLQIADPVFRERAVHDDAAEAGNRSDLRERRTVQFGIVDRQILLMGMIQSQFVDHGIRIIGIGEAGLQADAPAG